MQRPSNHGVKHLGIIMDGNRRWAKQRGLPSLEGHRRGYDAFRRVGEWCLDRGIEILTVYAFSTQNWDRSKKEVNYLMRLLSHALSSEIDDLHRKNIRVRVIGRIKELPSHLQKHIAEAMELTKNNTRGTLQLAINYGGHEEIVDAVRKVMKTAKRASQITEKSLTEAMYTAGQPDPDLIIRTSGEQRLSGFLTWQGVYSELLFMNKHWPDFNEADLDAALVEFGRRQRRFGQ
ncbi:MAG: di-trans,poly-cis-decaprenylcistransferase [Candidatus Kerfeldbacteria bacterium]|nr:di-trans,poly-cis-decaprenylcistransferase [Candidatus Kerfeldbacteria bacterium]